ncbi:MAG: hypothetical protein GY948_20240 [Alphaproteobacteria bacterium]|nr:hypothetical protein [Alphaproteobacteria bacterium]
MTGKHSIVLSVSTLGLALATGFMWHLMPRQATFSPTDLQVGQSRAEAEAAFAGQGFFGRTCFGELAVFADRQEDGHEQHVMAFIDEATNKVEAVEVQQVETPVSAPSQCMAVVRSAAKRIATDVNWSSVDLAKYSAGATQRYFLRQRGAGGRMWEIWGEHKGAAGFQTCDLYWRTSVPGREQLGADGEWNIPGDGSVPFDPFKVARSDQSSKN